MEVKLKKYKHFKPYLMTISMPLLSLHLRVITHCWCTLLGLVSYHFVCVCVCICVLLCKLLDIRCLWIWVEALLGTRLHVLQLTIILGLDVLVGVSLLTCTFQICPVSWQDHQIVHLKEERNRERRERKSRKSRTGKGGERSISSEWVS